MRAGSASIGVIRLARKAGYSPARTPEAVPVTGAAASKLKDITGAQPWLAHTAAMTSTPALAPITPPAVPVIPASQSTSVTMCRGVAPTERRSPISERRCSTESNDVLAIAITPTASATRAIARSSEVSDAPLQTGATGLGQPEPRR